MLIIVVAAIAYYGSYWHYWFNTHDEGGTACLIAQRLMNGEQPWVGVEPGYNIGWFYPLIALFKITGVNYMAARAWFFLLSTITALLGFGIVSRITGSRLAGLGVGLLLVMLPGSQFKNYIQLSQAANTACLISLAFVDPRKKGKWLGSVLLGGVVLGLTYLVRVELGYFFTAIWALLLLVFLFDRRVSIGGRLVAAIVGFVALAAGVVAAQTPAYLDLRGRGLEAQYWHEYSNWLTFLRASATQKLHRATRTTPHTAPNPVTEHLALGTDSRSAPPASALVAAAPKGVATGADHAILARTPITALWGHDMKGRLLGFLTYAPLVGFAVFFLAGLAGFLRGITRPEFALTARPFLWLLLVGASLTTFLQFFFFRPDRPHLSEFMTGYIVAMAVCLWLLWPRGEARPLGQRIPVWALAVFLGSQLVIYTIFAMQHPSSGTIAARFGRKAWFRGENGVSVREFKNDAASLQGVHDAVMKASGPKDYVICFPYNPGYNVMTNRRTYLYNVYVDNATRPANFSEKTIRDFETMKPAVVIIDNRAINGTEASRFTKWAPQVYEYLKANYTLAGAFKESVEVFTRPAAEEAK